MSPNENGAPAVTTQDDPERTKLNAAIPIEPSTKNQELVAALRRDFVSEALRIVSIKTAHSSDDVLLGDDISEYLDRGKSSVNLP